MQPRWKTILIQTLVLPFCLGAAPSAQEKQAPPAYSVASPTERIVVIRLKTKMDMLDGLKQAVAREKIKNAVIVNGFGSVTRYHVHVVSNTTFPPTNAFIKEEGAFDLLAVSGLVIDGRVHAHVTLAGKNKTTGGHLEPGTSVFTFAIITLNVIADSADLTRVDDYKWN
jgi:predicted DNA-binding protein with PD1-like motif